jgi:hypothetical protein
MDVLDFLDDTAKEAAFASCWKKLQASEGGCIDLETLRVCVRLLPPAAKVSNEPMLKGSESKGKWIF